MNKEIKYSILLATYNKIEYLKYSIKTILNSSFQNFELIVSDDSSTDGTYEYLKSIKSPNLKIIKPKNKLTVAKNFEYLLNFASGEWITFIGDDDGVFPNFFEIAENFTNKYSSVPIIKFNQAIFYWKGCEDLYGNRIFSFETLKRKPKLKNSKISLFFALMGINSTQDLPSLYTSSLVKKDTIDKIKSKSNNFFFHSIIPDYYSMIALCLESKKYLSIDRPIFWTGVTNKSGGRGRKVYISSSRYLKNETEFALNENLYFSEDISRTLHSIGLYPIYLYEAILKHPYKNKFWQSKYLRLIAYTNATIEFLMFKKNMKYRLKTNLSYAAYFKLICREIKKYKLNLTVFIIYTFCFFILKPFIKLFKRTLKYLEKKSKKMIGLKVQFFSSKNRHNYPDIVTLNNKIEKLYKD